MQNRVIAIGGLETAYMRKLALYLSTRLDGQAKVAIVGETEPEQNEKSKIVWVGSEEFVNRIREQKKTVDCIVLSEERSDDESVICRYQPGEKICQKIMFLCRKMTNIPDVHVSSGRQKWVVMTTDSTASQLLRFSLVAAHILKDRGKVLYLNLTACSGMEALLQTGHGTDLSDLVLAYRKEQAFGLDAFVRHVESVDCIFSPDNPSVLYELRADDLLGLMRLIQSEQKYDYVLVALGNACCGCELFFRQAEIVFHLSRDGEAFAGCTEEWLRFIRLCLEPRQTPVRQVSLPMCRTDESGIHLLYEWRENVIGQLAGKCLEDV